MGDSTPTEAKHGTPLIEVGVLEVDKCGTILGKVEVNMIVLTILRYFLLGIGIVLAAIIVVPYDYRAAGERSGESDVSVLISWLFGGLKLDSRKRSRKKNELVLTILGFKKIVNMSSRSKSSSTSEKDTDHGGDAKNIQPKNNGNFRKYLQKDIIHKTLSIVLKIFKHCQPHKLSIDGKYGFDDPSYTGLMCAFTSQFYWLFDKYDISIQPVFDEEILEGSFLVGGRIWLPYLILVMIGFLVTKPIRNILITQLKLKIKGGLQYVR